MPEIKGYVSEVFGSFQGEGPFIGERHVFVRFAGCTLGCAYCDTPGSTGPAGDDDSAASIERPGGHGEIYLPNPVDARTVAESVLALEPFPGYNAKVSVTGGEPLEQPEFLGALLAGLGGRLPVLLETNGVHPDALLGVKGLLSVVSMDVKLPSVTGTAPLWDEHAAFMDAARGVELVVKTVVSGDTTVAEITCAAGLAAEHAPGSVFVIQPVTSGGNVRSVDGGLLTGFYSEARRFVERVLVIPQAHRIMGVK